MFEAVQRRYEYGVVFFVAGRFFALYCFDPDGAGPVDGYWGTIGRGERFLPLIEPIPGLGYCLESRFGYPAELEVYEMNFVEGEGTIELEDSEGRPVRLDVARRTWSARW